MITKILNNLEDNVVKFVTLNMFYLSNVLTKLKYIIFAEIIVLYLYCL